MQPVATDKHEELNIRMPFDILVEYWNRKSAVRLHVNIMLFNENNICVFTTTTLGEPNWHGREFPEGLFRSVCHVPGDLLNNGRYRVRIMLVRDTSIVVYKMDDAIVFDLQDSPDRRGHWFGAMSGVVRPLLEWETERLDAEVNF
jgi:lipopolysaccharide transport system ATP-binding protein